MSLSAAVMASDVSRSAASNPRPHAADVDDSGSLWRQTNANPALSRDNASERILTVATIKRARLLRTLQPELSAPVQDETCNFPGPDGPAQSPMFEPGGRLFVGTPNSVTEYNPANGRLKDQIALQPERNFYLSVARGVLVSDGVNCDSVSDPTGLAEVHNAVNGQKVWHGEPAVDNDEGVASVNLVQDGSQIFAAFGSLSAINALTGTTQWKQGNCSPYSTVFVSGGNVISQSCDENGNDLSAFDPKTGRILWTRRDGLLPIRSDSATASQAQVYVQRSNGNFAALGAARGNTLFNLPGATGILAADKTRIYAGCGSSGADICAFAKTNGALLWIAKEAVDQISQYPDGFQPLVAVGGNVVYVGNGAVLNAATGNSITHLWKTGTATALAVGDGYVAADTGDGALKLYGLPS